MRIIGKILADYSGCFHLRHPYELGGAAFSLNVVWSQVFPFVALQLYDGVESKDNIMSFLTASLAVWLVLMVAFICTADLKYLSTFFSAKTAPEYTCELFLTSKEDSAKFRAAFKNRINYTTSIHPAINEWVAENIDRWKEDKENWFKIEKIPDDFLPTAVLDEEGGARRERRKSSVLGVLGLEIEESIVGGSRRRRRSARASVYPALDSIKREKNRKKIKQWRTLAEDVYDTRSNIFKSNYIHVKRIFNDNEALVANLMELCPPFKLILSFIIEDRFGFS